MGWTLGEDWVLGELNPKEDGSVVRSENVLALKITVDAFKAIEFTANDTVKMMKVLKGN
jgi:hypothetical protein